MGRHSSEQRAAFYRSLLAWAIPWAVVAAIVGVAVWFAVGALSGDEVTSSPPPGTTGAGSTAGLDSSPTPDATPEPTPAEEKASEGKDGKATELDVAGVRVQVLNGTGGVTGAAEAMADRLGTLGYDIVAVGDALTVERTVVYWSGPEDLSAARALARRFNWARSKAPPDLSETVDVHVIVGPDETPH